MTKIEKFDKEYEIEIKNGSEITKDDMAQRGFFPKKNTNGRDIRFVTNKYETVLKSEGNKVVSFRIIGLKKTSTNRAIRKDIKDKLKKEKCVITGLTSNIEIDHKNGRYNDERVLNTETQTIDDFQPLNKLMNNMKREICKKCSETTKKYDAKQRNKWVSTLDGAIEHNGQSDGCIGCYFYDPVYFEKMERIILSRYFGEGKKFNEKDFHKYFIEYKKTQQ